MRFSYLFLCFITCISICSSTKLIGMPGVSEDTTTKTLDKQIAIDLASITIYTPIQDTIQILKNILNNVSNQTTSDQSKINFCNEIKNLNAIAKRQTLKKEQINDLLKLLKQTQTSTLLSTSFTKNISDLIKYWEKRLQNVGLSRFQQALQRKQTSSKKRN